MLALNALLELLLVFAVFFYFAGFIAPALRWRLWRWAAGLVALVFSLVFVVVEVRAHPIAAFCIAAGMSFVAYGVLQVRREHRERAHRRTDSTPFLNLRVTGKTAVDLRDDHPFSEREEHE